MRRLWLTGLISEVHIASRQTYGSRRIHAELTIGMKVQVSERLVAVLMSKAGIRGLPGPAKVKRLHGIATADDLVHRKFHRLSPNELWITDITEHPTREGKIYCCAVMDTFSRKIVGWSIDNAQDSALVVNALDMAIKNRQPPAGGIVHADHGVQFTSWAFTNKIRSSGLMPSFGTIGDCYDNAMMESFWSSMQIELLNRKKWRTRLDLANAIFDYIEIFYNRQRRHSQLEYLSPVEHELRFTPTPISA
jgi:putative transposase